MRKFNRQMITNAVLVLRRSFLTLTCLATAGMLFTAAPALADNPHYQFANASIDPNNFCYSVNLKEAGLGNSGATSVTYDLSCSATFTAQCFTRNGNPVEGTVKQGSGTATSSTILPIRNGQTTGAVSLCPASFSLGLPGCTGNQVQRITSASYSNCTLDDGLGTQSPSLPDLHTP
jgi:hypothetical protein